MCRMKGSTRVMRMEIAMAGRCPAMASLVGI
jgi:hypothetical protein